MDLIDFQKLKKEKDLHFWYKARLNLIYNLLNSIFLQGNEKRKILNIGCGTGTEIKILQNFGQTIALDINEEALKIAGQNHCEIILADIENCRLSSQAYDAICCFDVLEHLKNDQGVLQNIFFGLKTNGYFLFTLPAYKILFGPHDLAIGHQRRYGKKEIKILLLKSGFKIVYLNYWNTLLFPAIFFLRIIKKLLFKNAAKNYLSQSEATQPPSCINKLLYFILNLENAKNLFRLPRPFGLSICGIAKKEKI